MEKANLSLILLSAGITLVRDSAEVQKNLCLLEFRSLLKIECCV